MVEQLEARAPIPGPVPAPADPAPIPAPAAPSSTPPFARDHLRLEFAAVLLATMGPGLALAALRYSSTGSGINAATLFAEGFMLAGWCLLVWFLLSRREAFDWNLPRSTVEWLKEVGWGLVLLVCLLAATLAVGALAQGLGLHGHAGPWSQPLSDPSTRLMFCLLVPLAALHEELLFRVYLQSRLTRFLTGRPAVVVLIGACLFATVHDYSVPGTLSVLAAGLILATSYQRNRRIPRLVIAHALLNLLLVVLS
jgi:membrane protease YdiL (CAAX protease family)